MKYEFCLIFFGSRVHWFGDENVMFLCLQFAGLAGLGRRSSYFAIHMPRRRRRNHGFRGKVLIKKPGLPHPPP